MTVAASDLGWFSRNCVGESESEYTVAGPTLLGLDVNVGDTKFWIGSCRGAY